MIAVAEAQRIRRRWPQLASNAGPLSLVAFTIFYFVDVCCRASTKHFWYDELLTLYFARLPDLHTLWGALQSGVESNPPAFHLLTRATEALFGEGLVTTRLPEIFSFWVLCLCLYKFVERRAGTMAGLVALTLPMLTGAYYYAYEARPLIIVVALGAVALLCWDNANRSTKRHAWLAAFGVSLLAAFMLHCYAILLIFPFALVEVIRTYHSRRISWPVWAALLLPLVPALPLYLILLRAFAVVTRGTLFALTFPAVWPQALKFYSFLLLPCSAILLLALILFAVGARGESLTNRDNSKPPGHFSWEDAILAGGFIALPALGVVLGKLVHSPYFGRYFLSALIGIVIVVAVKSGLEPARKHVAAILLAVICLSLLTNFARLMRHWQQGSGEMLIEPSTLEPLSTTRGQPLEWFPLLSSIPDDSSPIVILKPLDFLYLNHYAPKLASRLYLWSPTGIHDATFRGLVAFRRWSPAPYNAPLIGPALVHSLPEFYMYSNSMKLEDFGRLARIADVKTLKVMEDSYLLKMQAKR